MTFGEALRAARKDAGYTQAKLAALIDADSTQLSGWETRSMPAHRTVVLLDRALGLLEGTLYLRCGMVTTEAAVAFVERLTIEERRKAMDAIESKGPTP